MQILNNWVYRYILYKKPKYIAKGDYDYLFLNISYKF